MESKTNIDKRNIFTTSDLKLATFIRLLLPNCFVGLNKNDARRVLFIFKKTVEVSKLVKDYLKGQKFKISPLHYGNMLDQNKQLIFGDFEL